MSEQIIKRNRASAIIIHDGHLLVHRGYSDDWWSLPGGGIEPGETSRQTVQREMREELHTDIKIRRLLFIVENFFTLEQKPYQQFEFQFLAELPLQSPLLDVAKTHSGIETEWTDASIPLIFRWFPVRELFMLDFPLKPTYLQHRLYTLPETVEHVIWWDE
ncbi:MAG: NUDIX domain-containing protein [Chloroflexota bacterium]